MSVFYHLMAQEDHITPDAAIIVYGKKEGWQLCLRLPQWSVVPLWLITSFFLNCCVICSCCQKKNEVMADYCVLYSYSFHKTLELKLALLLSPGSLK